MMYERESASATMASGMRATGEPKAFRGAEEPSNAPLHELANLIGSSQSHVASLIDKTKGIADSLLGAVPEGKELGAKNGRSGLVGSLIDSASVLMSSLDELERQINRINQIG